MHIINILNPSTISNNRMKCLKCGYEWEQRKPNPVSCPECKSRLHRQGEDGNTNSEADITAES